MNQGQATRRDTGSGAGPRSPRLTNGQRRALTGLAFCIPLFVVWGLLLVLPIGQTFYYSFTTWNGLSSTWQGFSTYLHLFRVPSFGRVLLNNGVLLLSVPIAVFVPLSIAFLLDSKVPGWRFFRGAFFLPATISWVVIGMVAVRFFTHDGILNQALGAIGLAGLQQNMLSSGRIAIIPVAITFIWSQVGPNTLILLTGLATIDRSLYDAARIDGADSMGLIRHISFPLLKRFLLLSLTITLIAAFTALFSLIFVMTGGGPGYATTTLEFYIYQRAFDQGQFGLGSTLGVVLLTIMVVVSLIQFRALRETP